MAAQHDRCGDLHIPCFPVDLSPVIQQSVLQHHSVWQEERESRSLLTHHEQAQLFAQFPVVTLLRLFHHGQVLIQLRLLRECCSIDPLKHLVLLAASPVSARKACQLKCFHRLCGHKVRSCAQVSELALGIEADRLVLRKILDQLHFVRLVFLLEVLDSLVSRHCILFDLKILLDDLLHLCLDLLQVFCRQRSISVYVIVETICDRRSDRQFCIRIKSLDGLSHDVRRCMAECAFSFLIGKCQDTQLAVFVDNSPQIYDLSVYLACCSHTGQSLADVFCNVVNTHGLLILFA